MRDLAKVRFGLFSVLHLTEESIAGFFGSYSNVASAVEDYSDIVMLSW